MNKKVDVLITHKNCPDGLTSALVTKYYHEQNNLEQPEIMFVLYGDKVNMDDIIGKKVLIADFSFSRDILEEWYEATESLVVLDHHTTARDNLEGLEFCKFDMTKCGARLTWEYFFPDKEAPKLVDYVEDRDLWLWKQPDSKEFSAGFRLVQDLDTLTNTYELKDLLGSVASKNFVISAIRLGKPILAYQEQQVRNKVKMASKLPVYNIAGYMVSCINNTELISEVGNEISKTNLFSAQYFITEDSIVFSLRSIGDFDVSAVAKKFDGGGHKNAAGFSIPIKNIDLNRFFTTRSLDGSFIDFYTTEYKELMKEIKSVESIIDDRLTERQDMQNEIDLYEEDDTSYEEEELEIIEESLKDLHTRLEMLYDKQEELSNTLGITGI